MTSKGHIISKCPCGVLNSSKKLMRKFNLQYYSTSSRIVFVFLEELKTPKGHFETN